MHLTSNGFIIPWTIELFNANNLNDDFFIKLAVGRGIHSDPNKTEARREINLASLLEEFNFTTEYNPETGHLSIFRKKF